ncbi:hypothetical protein LCGC14_1989760 [marine sediment metagenome]|uniref:Uncharacterized protein n=1 Tax=marine sediment metagenome TaxID=412755 RepID=A0A0F9HJR1_9ZZZZ
MKIKSWNPDNPNIMTAELDKKEMELIRKNFNQTFPGKALNAFTLILRT